jgi:hypothetical protein
LFTTPTMHLNYIVLAHKDPAQISRMVSRLDTPDTRFYINIDRPMSLEPFQAALGHNRRCTFFTGEERLNTMWGHVNAVKAALIGIEHILADKRTGYTILLSGQDYPLKSNVYIQQFFTENYGTNFIECFSLPVTSATASTSIHGGLNRASWIHPEYGSNGGLNRLQHYTFFLSQKREDNVSIPPILSRDFIRSGKARYALGILRLQPHNFFRLFTKRKFPVELTPYAGSQWWALPHETVAFLNNYVKEKPYFLKFNNDTLLSDEIFCQTVVGNYFLNIGSPVTYVNFMRPKGPWPATFTAADISELTTTPCLYARKFDPVVSTEIFDKLDALNGQ